jgi:hypothetical protein
MKESRLRHSEHEAVMTLSCRCDYNHIVESRVTMQLPEWFESKRIPSILHCHEEGFGRVEEFRRSRGALGLHCFMNQDLCDSISSTSEFLSRRPLFNFLVAHDWGYAQLRSSGTSRRKRVLVGAVHRRNSFVLQNYFRPSSILRN